MIVKNPTDIDVGPYQFKDDTYGPIPAQEQISGVPDSVAYWMRDTIHNFLIVQPEAPKAIAMPTAAPKVEVVPEVSAPEAEIPKVEKPKTK